MSYDDDDDEGVVDADGLECEVFVCVYDCSLCLVRPSEKRVCPTPPRPSSLVTLPVDSSSHPAD